MAVKAGARPRTARVGSGVDRPTVFYLWLLLGLELLATVALRSWSSGHHGG